MSAPARSETDTPLMSVREVAALLGYESEWPVRRLIAAGELRAYKLRGRLRISQAAVDELLAGAQVAPAAPAPRPARSERAGGGGAADTAQFLLERRKARRRSRG